VNICYQCSKDFAVVLTKCLRNQHDLSVLTEKSGMVKSSYAISKDQR